MVKGIGIDVIEIDRMEKALARQPRLRERLFSPREIMYCLGKSHPAASFAARFAAKEAVRKACGTGEGEVMHWREIEIILEGGSPCIHLAQKAARLASRQGVKNLLVSLTHSRDYACAVVLALGGPQDSPEGLTAKEGF
ncbi:MAG: holo-ACP synthase [Bacillota bacterium]|nr:holo-ACP synthase [Bacillota bacterium]